MTEVAKPKVLLLGSINYAHDAWSRLSQKATIVTPSATNRAEFLAEARSGRWDDVAVIYRTVYSAETTGLFDDELIAALPSSVRFICHNAAGYDQIDVAACTARGIAVSNTRTAVDDATADIAIFLLLGTLRNLPGSMASLRRGEWRGRPGHLPALGHDPRGKTLGILGMGGIGRNLARKAQAFGMRTRYHNRTRLDPALEKECDVEYVDLDTLLATSDVLSLNLPLNRHTRHIISTAEFAKMKEGIIIINTARGAVLDEEALVAALKSGRVASAGLDVFENEPAVHPELLANEDVLLVPHMGTWTVETLTSMEEWTIRNVQMALEQGKLLSIVPEQASMSLG